MVFVVAGNDVIESGVDLPAFQQRSAATQTANRNQPRIETPENISGGGDALTLKRDIHFVDEQMSS